MMEDDLILRGFTQATRGRLRQSSNHQPHAFSVPAIKQKVTNTTPVYKSAVDLPSRSQIIAQFGPRLGPQILDVVSRQTAPTQGVASREVESPWQIPHHVERVHDLSRRIVEPHWQVPDMPVSMPASRPRVKGHTSDLHQERSSSPEAGFSLWAPSVPKSKSRRHENRQSGSGVKRVRNTFTTADDETMLDCVRKARMRGRKLNQSFWLGLAAQVSSDQCPNATRLT